MKQQLVGTLVGGLILFVWQFLSWAMLNVHADAFKYTANQDSILNALSQNLTEEGTYMLPMPTPDSSPEDQQRMMESMVGKPWASISYHQSYSDSMGMSMFRGFVVDLLAVFLLIWLLSKFAQSDMKTTIFASLTVGGIGFLTIPYMNSIWFETSSIGYIVDAVVQWGLVGAWLGWWLNRK